jgi:hypothetical protein
VEYEMERDELEARRSVRAALQHRRTHRLARYEDLAGRRHELVALRAGERIVICDRTVRAVARPIGCVAVLAHSEAGTVGALVADYLRWAPLCERVGIREVRPEDVEGRTHEGAVVDGRPPSWQALCREMTAACRAELDQRPRRREALAA